jgi:hypothetical protein
MVMIFIILKKYLIIKICNYFLFIRIKNIYIKMNVPAIKLSKSNVDIYYIESYKLRISIYKKEIFIMRTEEIKMIDNAIINNIMVSKDWVDKCDRYLLLIDESRNMKDDIVNKDIINEVIIR